MASLATHLSYDISVLTIHPAIDFESPAGAGQRVSAPGVSKPTARTRAFCPPRLPVSATESLVRALAKRIPATQKAASKEAPHTSQAERSACWGTWPNAFVALLGRQSWGPPLSFHVWRELGVGGGTQSEQKDSGRKLHPSGPARAHLRAKRSERLQHTSRRAVPITFWPVPFGQVESEKKRKGRNNARNAA